MNLFSVEGRIALVTGGRRGLGLAMVKGLLEAGAKVAVVARSGDPGALAGLEPSRFLYLQADLCDREARKDLIQQVVEHFGALHILVNNAGIQSRAPLLDYSQDQWDLDLELLLTVVWDLSRQAAGFMKGYGGGAIIHLASISSFQGARNIVGYTTAKHGLVGMTKAMANEWAPLGIRVNALAPGLFDTDMATHVTRDPARAAELLGRIPSGRFGQPEDLVGPLLFLASEASRHVHGHVLLVDGGWMGR